MFALRHAGVRVTLWMLAWLAASPQLHAGELPSDKRGIAKPLFTFCGEVSAGVAMPSDREREAEAARHELPQSFTVRECLDFIDAHFDLYQDWRTKGAPISGLQRL
jgi:hypothetical protein